MEGMGRGRMTHGFLVCEMQWMVVPFSGPGDPGKEPNWFWTMSCEQTYESEDTLRYPKKVI